MESAFSPSSPIFDVLVSGENGAARTGLLKLGEKTQLTPALFLHSRQGSPQNLTPDLIEKIDELKSVSINLRDFIIQADIFAKYGKGAHKFLVLDDKILFMGHTDPAEFDPAPVIGKSLNINHIGGKRKIDSKGYLNLQKHMKMDIFSSLSFDVQFHSGNKKIGKCVDSTLNWLDEILTLQSQNPSELSNGSMFAVVQGSSNEMERNRCIQGIIELQKKHQTKSIHGFTIAGFGYDEFPQERSNHIKLSTNTLPDAYPRLTPGLERPEDILDAVSEGIDLFHNNYPSKMADMGNALVFLYDLLENSTGNGDTAVEVVLKTEGDEIKLEDGGDRNRLNLRDPVFELDKRPLIPGCSCYTCQRHTRAYIHHLINTQEMLANILLVVHNTHHYLQFFKSIREAISKHKFEQYREKFLQEYRKIPAYSMQ